MFGRKSCDNDLNTNSLCNIGDVAEHYPCAVFEAIVVRKMSSETENSLGMITRMTLWTL